MKPRKLEIPRGMRPKRKGARLYEGQRVVCNVRGYEFLATLKERDPEVHGGWVIEPEPNLSFYHVTAKQITWIERGYDPMASQIRAA